MSDDPPRKLIPDGASGEATLRGTIASVVYQAPDGQFAIVKLEGLDGRASTIVGDLGTLVVGEPVRVAGRWEEHPQHGTQFRAAAVVPELPTTPDGIRRLLGSGFVEGIGPEMARRIVEKYGNATLDVILDHPHRLREISGIGRGRSARIQESFRTRRAESEARAFLQAAGIGPALAQRVIKRYGDQTANVVRQDPYRLAMEVSGVGFRTADRIGHQLGIPDDDPRRARAAIVHAVNEASEQGHTGMPVPQMLEVMSEWGVPAHRVEEALGALTASRTLVSDRDLLYPPPLHRAEVDLAAALRRCVHDGVEPIDPRVLGRAEVTRALEPLHALQREAVRAILTSPLLVITGGPGTGKTTTVRAIVSLMASAGKTIELAAPTGRAARRLTEATGQPARTLHRMLEWIPRLGRFARDERTPLLADLVLVDEVSMLDVSLAARLVAALPRGARLVLVGDADQLPSVGPGTVLADLLATPWIPSVRLTEVFRQAALSAIVRGAHQVLHGEVPTPSPARAKDHTAPPAGELFLIPVHDAERAAELLVSTVVERIPRSFGLNPLRDIQVLVPVHRGPLGAAALNAALQRALNPSAAPVATSDAPPRPAAGDKVMQMRNDYDLEVWNGDIGTVSFADKERFMVAMEGRDVKYTGEARDALALAYAATVHKAQGSEYDAVVIGLHTQHFVLLQRALIYTAITRARRLVVIVGSPRALQLAVRNARTAERHGALRARLGATP